MAIIQSLLDTDLYKFSMQQCVLHQFPDTMVEYEFKLRNLPQMTRSFRHMIFDIHDEVDKLCKLKFTNEELAYLSKLSWFKPDYIEYLHMFRLNRSYLRVDGTEKSDELAINIKGPWLSTILYEVPVLAIVSEIYSRRISRPAIMREEGQTRLLQKIAFINECQKDISGFRFADFGTRRRYTREWQEEVVETLADALPQHFIGTSNVYLARKYKLKPIGTMAHEYVMAAQGMKNVRLSESQKYAFDTWAREYRGQLGIALSDTLGMDAFFRDFDLYFSKLFDGCRHDSGDPYVWCDKLIAHYKSLGIDPKTKTAVFSDGLNFHKALDIYWHYKDQINMSFGIGTDLMNDVGNTAPQIVIKMTKCNGQPVAKISDSPGKMMCQDKEYLNYLASVFKIPKVWEE